MGQDSMGAVSQLPVTLSAKSSGISATVRNTRFNQNDARALIARLLVNWPYRREEVLDEQIYKLMQAELVQHFGTYDRTLVSEATTRAIGQSKQWPSVALIMECVKELRVVPPKPPAPPEDDGYRPPTREEIARVTAALTAWRKTRTDVYDRWGNTIKAKDDELPLDRPFTAEEIESAKRLRGRE